MIVFLQGFSGPFTMQPTGQMRFTRRALFEATARIAGTAAGVEFFSGWAMGSPVHRHGETSAAAPAEDYQPQFFSLPDFRMLQAFTEILIPTDDAPGAREARCADFIDFMLSQMGTFAPDTQAEWRSAMALLHDSGFASANASDRTTIVQAMALPEIDRQAQHPAFTAYRLIKRETTFAFFTSRAGIIEALDYRGNSYNLVFPACTHPEHHTIAESGS